MLLKQIKIIKIIIIIDLCILIVSKDVISVILYFCRHYLRDMGKIGEVSMTKDDLNRLIQTAESARMKLYKNIDVSEQTKDN